MISRRRATQLLSAPFLSTAAAAIALAPVRSGAAELLHPEINSGAELLRAAKTLAGRQNDGIVLLIPKGSLANVDPVARHFSQETGVSISYKQTAVDEINTTILAEGLLERSSFDVALPATFGIPDLVSAETLLPLDAFEQKYSHTVQESEALYTIGDRFLGKTYGFQTDGDIYVMFYKKSLFEDATEQARFFDHHGWHLRIPQTWSELDAVLKFFHRPEQSFYGGALFRNAGYMVWEWWIRFHANGAWPVDGDFRAQINSEAGRQALESMVATADYMYPSARSDGLFDNWRAFAAGNIACNIGWGGSQKYFNSAKSNIRGDLLFGETPGGVHNGQALSIPYFNWGWNYTVSRYSRQPELAYLFARYAVTSGISTKAIRHLDGYFDPYRREHYDDHDIEHAYSRGFLDVHRKSLETCIPDFYILGKGEYFDVLIESIGRAMEKKQPVQRILDLAARQWDLITERLGRDKQIAQWESLKKRYPKAIATYIMQKTA